MRRLLVLLGCLMALEFDHGAIQWLTADAATTVYTVSGLSFQPKGLRFYWMGLGSATDTANDTTHSRRGIGFATSTSDRKSVATQDQDAAGSMTCTSMYATDCVAMTVTSTPARDGALDLNSITSDGFTLIVDDAAPVNVTVFWEAWGGTDITVATTVPIAEPAATGNQDYTVTGFVAAATDQVVMFAGVQSVSAAGTAERNDSGLCVGFASSGTAADNITLVGNNDDGSAAADTDGYCQTDECLAMITVAGGNPNARAQLTQFGTDNFRLNWIARGVTNRRYIALAIKGGNWKAGSLATGAVPGGGETVTLSGLAFTPKGLCLMTRVTAEQTAGTAATLDRLSLGSGTSTTSRRCMGHLSEDGTASAEIDLAIEYDQILVAPSEFGGVISRMDINAMNADGFQIITEDAGYPASTWLGYLTFGDAASTDTLMGAIAI